MNVNCWNGTDCVEMVTPTCAFAVVQLPLFSILFCIICKRHSICYFPSPVCSRGYAKDCESVDLVLMVALHTSWLSLERYHTYYSNCFHSFSPFQLCSIRCRSPLNLCINKEWQSKDCQIMGPCLFKPETVFDIWSKWKPWKVFRKPSLKIIFFCVCISMMYKTSPVSLSTEFKKMLKASTLKSRSGQTTIFCFLFPFVELYSYLVRVFGTSIVR